MPPNPQSDDEATETPTVVKFVSPIASPLAGKKLQSKVFKAVKKGECLLRRHGEPVSVWGGQSQRRGEVGNPALVSMRGAWPS